MGTTISVGADGTGILNLSEAELDTVQSTLTEINVGYVVTQTGNLADAQDLAQDVFMRAYEKLDHLREPERFGKWLVGIARFRCREWRRRNSPGRDKRVALNDAQLVVSNPPDDDQIELLREMITTLPEKERLALHTFYLQERSAENARRIMGLSRSGFYRVLERARKRLEQLMPGEQEDIL